MLERLLIYFFLALAAVGLLANVARLFGFL